jgi:Small, acid-soluble spore proteins, alpha/beta type.
VNEKLKLEAAKELGLLEKAYKVGWSNLTAQETGKIGAIVKKRKKIKLRDANSSLSDILVFER